MQVFQTIQEACPLGKSAVALGYFDGLHIGHAAVIGRAVQSAHPDLHPCVFTFTMNGFHPASKQEGCEIITDTKKYHMLKKWGVELVLSPDFAEFKDLTPEEFLDEVLVRRMNSQVICCGYDYRFGRRASAGVAELAMLCNERGIELDIIPAVNQGGERISSTRIRRMLGEGDVENAGKLLGRTFGYDFTVVQGKKMGRTIDSPTINQRIPRDFVKLRRGVYASAAVVNGVLHPSVTNIGVRPTVEDSMAVNSETYIHGFSGNLYGQDVEVRLLKFIRDERRFSSVEALKTQIQADIRVSVPISETYIASKAAK